MSTTKEPVFESNETVILWTVHFLSGGGGGGHEKKMVLKGGQKKK